MISKSTLTEVALDYLRFVAKILEAQIGRHPKCLRRSEWMVRTSPTSMSGQEFSREVFDITRASMIYQTKILHANPSQQQQLIETLVIAGIEPRETHYGFLLPLVHHWLDLEDPFGFYDKQISKLLDEFSDTVLKGLILTKSRRVIQMLELKAKPLSLEKGISIRPISSSELWELGEISDLKRHPYYPGDPSSFVSEDWNILDVEIQHERTQVHPPVFLEAVHGAILTALALASSGHLQIYDLGTTANYGMGASGTVRMGRPMPREIGRLGGRYILDADVSKRLKDLWPHLKKIIEAERHYLRIPAQRLVDGGGRYREDDVIIDYAIGLEALLLKGITYELSYRFSLRGATILAWNGGRREELFKQLRAFYDIRSKIVHGSHVDSVKLKDARLNGEKALRGIWWWYFENNESLSRTLAKVDKVILK